MTGQGIFALFVLAGVLGCVEIGRRLGVRGAHADAGITDIVDGAVFGLLSLLVTFTFSGAAARFEGRRQLMGEEANVIGTAYQRLDLLPEQAQGPLKEKLRQYTDARIAFFRRLPDIPAARLELARSDRLQAAIWSEAVAVTRDSSVLPLMVLPALNEAFDVTTTQRVAAEMHPPEVIYGMLGGLALVTGLLLGRRLAQSTSRNRLNGVLYACVVAGVVFVIRDIEFPRGGLIRVDTADQVLIDVRDGMK